MTHSPVTASSGPRIRKAVGIHLGAAGSASALLDMADCAFVTGRDEQCLVVGTETPTPPQAVARILVSLRDVLARTLGDPRYVLDTAVFAVPATLDQDQNEAIRQAARLANFEVVELLPEPAAAAIYHCWVESHGEPLLHEPDLGIVYGAALRAATQGTHYLGLPGNLELHLTSSPHTQEGTERDRLYRVTGGVGGPGGADFGQGGSVRVRSFATGLTFESFLDARGAFSLEVELQPDTDNAVEVAILSPAGDEVACVPLSVRHGKTNQGPTLASPQPPLTSGPFVQPSLPSLSRLVRRCLDLAADVADATGRKREELFEHVYTQERYAEQACEENNQQVYRECFDNLGKYAGYLEQLLGDALPRPMRRSARCPEEEARDGLEQFRAGLADVWKKVRAKGRTDLDERLAQVARQGQGLAQRARTDPLAALREVRRLLGEIDKVAEQLQADPAPPAGGDPGPLEGTP
jgi:hypothetical protein